MASRKTIGQAGTQPASKPASSSSSGGKSTYDKLIGRTEQAKETTPFLGQVGKEFAQTMGGTGEAVAGVFSGDGKRAKEGMKQVGEGVLSAVTGGALRGLNEPPKPSYLGGSAEALQQRRDMYTSGIGTGQNIQAAGLNLAGQGAGMLGQAGGMAQQDRGAAYGLANTGLGIGAQGIGSQDTALNAAIANASRDVGSVAQQQQRMANDMQARQMMGMAASARGGNQAAAMRNAGAQASQNSLITQQLLGLMRLQEAQNQRDAITQAQQMAASQYGGRAQLGYGLAGQGLNAAQQSTGQFGNMGAQTGQLGIQAAGVGTQSQGQYLDALTETDKAQLGADQAQSDEAQKAKGGVAGVVGKVIGSIF